MQHAVPHGVGVESYHNSIEEVRYIGESHTEEWEIVVPLSGCRDYVYIILVVYLS
jgi:hypothetical protein